MIGKTISKELLNFIKGENNMPLTKKGKKVKEEFQKEYGSKKGEQIFYATENKRKMKGLVKKTKKKAKK